MKIRRLTPSHTRRQPAASRTPAANPRRRGLRWLLAFMLANSLFSGTALGFTNAQFNATLGDWPFYVFNDTDCTSAAAQSASTTPTGSYITVGNIPVGGKQIGTTTYGGNYTSGAWGPSNNQQGGPQPYDDNGMGNDGKPLPGRTAYAELNLGSALGNLPEYTKLEITYNGKSIIAEKDDIGGGGGPINGLPRGLDLWWETARLLGFTVGSGVVTIHAVDPKTPVTPLDGQPADASPIGTNTNTIASCCAGTATASGALSGADNEQKAFNYFVTQGLSGAQAAGIVGNLMQESGVNPNDVNTAGHAGGSIVQWEGGRWTEFLNYVKQYGNGRAQNDLSVQLDFMWAELTGNQGVSKQPGLAEVKAKTTPGDAAVAFEQAYERAGDPQMQNRIQYANEAYAKWGGLGPAGGTAPTTFSCVNGGAGASAQKIIQTALGGFAWGEPCGPYNHPCSQPTAAYANTSSGMVNPGGLDPYTDCGTFVATVMIRGGIDPNYPKVGTAEQAAYVQKNPTKYTIIRQPKSTDQLQPGDILIFNNGIEGHTMIYVGAQGGPYPRVDASWHDHTPQRNTPGGLPWMFAQPNLIAVRVVQ